MDVAFIPAHLAAKFHAAEAATEAAMLAKTELLTALIEARGELGVSAPAAQAVIAAVMESINHDAKSQEALCKGHTLADVLRRKLGLVLKMTGVWKDTVGAQESERAVAQAA